MFESHFSYIFLMIYLESSDISPYIGRKMERLVLPGGSTENIRYATWCGPGNSIVSIFAVSCSCI